MIKCCGSPCQHQIEYSDGERVLQAPLPILKVATPSADVTTITANVTGSYTQDF